MPNQTSQTIPVSSQKATATVLLAALAICSLAPAAAAEVCPKRPGHPLRGVDVFDGTPEERATLVPDDPQESFGRWSLRYIYEAGRIVTVRCRYADGHAADVTLSKQVDTCEYRVRANKTLKLDCR